MNACVFLLIGLLNLVQLPRDQKPLMRDPVVERIVGEVSAGHIRTNVEQLVSFGTRHTLSDTVSNVRGIGAARRWLKSQFEIHGRHSGARLRSSYHELMVAPSRRIPAPTRIVNVVAVLDPPNTPTSDPNRMIVVGAHYDSRASDPMDAESDAPGANDDGSGTALVLELARVLSKFQFDATIVFIAFSAEEQGLLGASAWAQEAVDNGWNIEAMLNNDMVGNILGGDGSIESTYVRIYAEALTPADTGRALRTRNLFGLENDGYSRTLARYVKETGERYVPSFGVRMIYRRDRFMRGGDHSPFHERGFAAVRFVDAREDYDHQHQVPRTEGGSSYGDLPAFMNFRYAENIAKVNAAVIASLARAPASPRGVTLVVSGLGYATTLRWNANRESDLAGYFVRVRETTSPFWQHEVFVRDTTVAVSYSKDDYLFGVQTVDHDGNRSLVVIPNPGR